MNVLELFRRLSLGELSNIAIGNNGAGSIKETDKAKVVLHANSTMRKLYTRFNIRQNELILETTNFRTNYPLHPQHALSQKSEDNPHDCFIMDSVENPFTGDFVRPLEAYDISGQKYAINDDGTHFSLYYTKPEVITVLNPLLGRIYSVVYQALPATLIDGDEDQEIEIPAVLETALQSGIAGEIYKNMNTQESAANAAQHLQNYEIECARVEENDLLARTYSHTGSKFEMNGWI